MAAARRSASALKTTLVVLLSVLGTICLLASLVFVHTNTTAAAAVIRTSLPYPPPHAAVIRTSLPFPHTGWTSPPPPPLPPPPNSARPRHPPCTHVESGREGVTLRTIHGDIRLLLRPEWTAPSAEFARRVGASGAATSNVYRLEPGFLIQGRLSSPVVKANHDTTRAPKVMERGEVGWAGGGAGPDYFIYLGTGPATWLGNPHDGTIFAEVADEESMEVAANISLLPVPPTAPGQMHVLKAPVVVTPGLWHPPQAHDERAAAPALGVRKVAGVALDTAAATCNASCNALAHTE